MRHLILFDGYCGLCELFVKFVLRHDEHDLFQFAALQSDAARELLSEFHEDAEKLHSVFVIADFNGPDRRWLRQGREALFVLDQFGGVWRLSRIFRILPAAVLDLAYDFVARHRYQIFGRRSETLPPPQGTARKFLS